MTVKLSDLTLSLLSLVRVLNLLESLTAITHSHIRVTHKHMDSHLLECSASPWPPEAPSSLQEDIRVSSRGENIRDQSSRDRDRLYRGHRSDNSRGGVATLDQQRLSRDWRYVDTFHCTLHSIFFSLSN